MISFHADGSVEFAFYRPSARTVSLAADFNQWNPARHELRRDGMGWWRMRVALTPGQHRFKYLVDGKIWEADFAAYGIEADRFGGWNSLLWVGDRTSGTATAASPRRAKAA